MKSKVTFSQMALVIVTTLLVLAVTLVPTASPTTFAQGNPTATPYEVDGGDDPTPDVGSSQPKGGGGKFTLPPTLEELTTQNPELKEYLDKVKDTAVGDFDFSELYSILVKLYDTEGLPGVIIFMRDSDLLEKLNIPEDYIDLLLLLDKEGRDVAIERARKLGIISDKDELRGFLLIDTDDKAAAVETELKGLGLSTYPYNAETGELEIGIPLSLMEGLQSPGELIGLFAQIGSVEGVTGFRVPKPNLGAANS
jgi:hypothetical protein